MIRSTSRTAACPHRCARCDRLIAVGERYRHAVASPHHEDLGNETWWALAECAECASICGRPIEAVA